MSIARAPHPLYAAVWGVLVLLMIGAGVAGHGWFATAVLASMAVWEAVAVVHRGKLRDTLSEITTWVNRYLSKHLRPLTGWNTLVAIQAIALWRLTYVVGVFWGGPPLYVAVVGGLFAWGQHAHWLDPGGNG